MEVRVQLNASNTVPWYPSNKRLTGPRDDLDMVIKQILLLRTEIMALRLVTITEILNLCLMTQK